jgi:hypothetical protein
VKHCEFCGQAATGKAHVADRTLRGTVNPGRGMQPIWVAVCSQCSQRMVNEGLDVQPTEQEDRDGN